MPLANPWIKPEPMLSRALPLPSAVHAKCEDQNTRKQLLNNLIDEEAGSPNHPELWLQFAEGLGVSASDVRRSEKWPETKSLIDTFRSLCRDESTAEGLAALARRA